MHGLSKLQENNIKKLETLRLTKLSIIIHIIVMAVRNLVESMKNLQEIESQTLQIYISIASIMITTKVRELETSIQLQYLYFTRRTILVLLCIACQFLLRRSSMLF